MFNKLNEDKRTELVARSRKSDKENDGKTRYEKRVKSRVATSTRQYNQIDMNQLFKNNILTVNIEVRGETDDYIVTLKFGGFLDQLHRELSKSNNKLDLRVLIRALVDSFNSDNVYIHCSCLQKDTKIKLLDGTSISVEELVDRFEKSESPIYVYSVDSNGDFAPGEVEKVWQTGVATKMLRITLDNNEVIETTPEHLYMLRDGTYVPAETLNVGQSLMPLYFNSNNGYEGVKFNSTGKYHSTYKVVAQKLKYSEMELAEKRFCADDIKMRYKVAVHHKDFNKSNNSPENLEIMTSGEHWLYHSKLAEKQQIITEQGRQNLRENCMRLNSNPTEQMLESRRNFIQKGVARNYDADRKIQQAEVTKNNMHNAYTEAVIEKRRDSYWKNHLNRMLSEGVVINEKNWEMFSAPGESHYGKFFKSFDELLEHLGYNDSYNHKIKDIEWIEYDEPIPVYDIKVKKYHNFLVDAGVILHNCPDWKYRMAYYATLNDINSGESESRPSNITNPNDTKGPGCKHTLLVLANHSWLIKVASVIMNYTKYMEKHQQRLYADVIYPSIYGTKYQEPVQLSIDDESDELSTDTNTIDAANKENNARTQFKTGNEYRIPKGYNNPDTQQSMFDTDIEEQ